MSLIAVESIDFFAFFCVESEVLVTVRAAVEGASDEDADFVPTAQRGTVQRAMRKRGKVGFISYDLLYLASRCSAISWKSFLRSLKECVR